MEKNEIFGLIFYISFAVLLIAYASLMLTVGKKNGKVKKCLNVILPVIVIAGILFAIFVMPTKSDEKDKYKPLSMGGMYTFSLLLIAVIALLVNIFDKQEIKSSTKELAFAGISTGLAFALSYVKIFTLPQGGSVTLASMFPIVLYSYVYGAKKGLFVGIIYGLLQFIQSPQVYEPMQVLLDYPVAFGAIGVAGIAKGFKTIKSPLAKLIVGASIGIGLRYVSHFLSGYYVFSSWALEGYTALTWSLVYNLFVFVDLAIVLAVGIALFSSKAFTRQLEKLNPQPVVCESEENSEEVEKD